jgi:hypothetical protein
MRLALLLSALATCAQPGRPLPRAPSTGPVPLTAKTLLVRLQRTMCYGTCPAYTVEVDQDGGVWYDGHAHVASCGRSRARLDAAATAALRGAIAEARLSQTADHCCDCVSSTDSPTVLVTVADGNHAQTINDYQGCDSTPARVRTLERRIDEIVETRRWVEGWWRSCHW